jgi:hypothetical protein
MNQAAVVTGQCFTFTTNEEEQLESLSWRIHGNLTLTPCGWRVLIVQDVTAMHRVIKGALDRSEKVEAELRRHDPRPI